MVYAERPSVVGGAVLWQRRVGTTPQPTRILPDGCLDLLWDGQRLVAVGPDSSARKHFSAAGAAYTALRFAGGLGPALIGVPASELRDQTVSVEQLWSPEEARNLIERVAADPVVGLESWARRRAAVRPVDPLGPRVLAMATAGVPVTVMADRLGLSARQLHRRCLPLFGYGPRRLARIQRLGRVLDQGRCGVPLGQAAAACGYADQAHLSREVRELAGTTPRQLLRELSRR